METVTMPAELPPRIDLRPGRDPVTSGRRMTASSKQTVGYFIRKTHIAISRALQQRLARYDLTSPQMIFMREIWIEEGLSQRELSARIGITEPTTVSALKVLERRKLIKRIAKARDRRAVRVYLTAAGRRLEKEVVPKIHAVNDAVIAGISAQDLAVLDKALARIRDNAAALVVAEPSRARRPARRGKAKQG
jgi:MarR family transcriptional regulator, organic hydroperoxide resistance regulator